MFIMFGIVSSYGRAFPVDVGAALLPLTPSEGHQYITDMAGDGERCNFSGNRFIDLTAHLQYIEACLNCRNFHLI